MFCGLIEKVCVQISHWELFSDISKWFRFFIWLQHNTLYGLNDSECMHIPCHFMDKNGESLDNEMRNLQFGWSHVKTYLSSSYKRGFIS